jgi:hypothetical protein
LFGVVVEIQDAVVSLEYREAWHFGDEFRNKAMVQEQSGAD